MAVRCVQRASAWLRTSSCLHSKKQIPSSSSRSMVKAAEWFVAIISEGSSKTPGPASCFSAGPFSRRHTCPRKPFACNTARSIQEGRVLCKVCKNCDCQPFRTHLNAHACITTTAPSSAVQLLPCNAEHKHHIFAGFSEQCLLLSRPCTFSPCAFFSPAATCEDVNYTLALKTISKYITSHASIREPSMASIAHDLGA